MADHIQAVKSRSWNGTPISRRTSDGYVNATAMAKASGKQWSHYRETDRATTYMEALSRNTEIRVTELYIAKPGEGTWIHPRLAVDFARWISADFAVWMDAWFLEEVARVSQVRDTQPARLDPAFAASLEAAKLLASAVELVGGNPQHSMARSLTVTGQAYPQFKELCFESQRLLNPGAEEFTNVSGLLAELERLLGVEKVRLLARMAKENGWLSKADPRHLVNVLLTRAGLQFKGGMRRDQASYIPTAEGAKLSREETRPDIQGSEAWVPQLLWLKEDTTKRLFSFIKDSLPTLSSANT